MKRIFLSALIGAGMVAAIFQILSGSAAARTPEDYPLVCRGGGSLVIGMAPGEGNIGFVFTRGTKPAGEGLAPGECSWVDRGMRPEEPDRLSQHVEDTESLKVGGTLAPENRWYEELHSSGKYWTFMVSNNGRGQLIATSARPGGGPEPKDEPTPVKLPRDCGMTLPCGGTVSSFPFAFSITNTGNGNGAGSFEIDNPASIGFALFATTNGTGAAFAARGLGGSSTAGLFTNENSSNNSNALEARTNGGGAAVYGSSWNGPAGHFEISNASNKSSALVGETNGSGAGVFGRTSSTVFNVAGVHGEATAKSGTVVGVYGAARNDPNGTGVAGFGSATGGYFNATGSSGKRVGVYGIGSSTGVSGQGAIGVYGESDGDAAVRGLNTGSGAAVVGVNTGSGAGVVGVSLNAKGPGGSFSNPKGGTALEVTGTASMSDVEVSVLTIKGGSDLAERFEVSDEAKPGMVMAIDPDHPGMLCIARGTNNRRVAGILSGANDLGAGMVLADLPGAKHSMPLALSGRVWVYADATSKAIEPGDLLTTADAAGYAMAVTDHVRAQGAIIGKAMTGLKHGKGMVLVFVTLQ
ncbi:MAG TPA: hypothetical protein VHE60_04780 [Pyrinomonadaceae bacterium]|nr:hypothetical protein [Pyrinomonadaceae bacterium]